jgi:hypothetical protein
MTRQVDAVKAGATSATAVLNLKMDATMSSIRSEHEAASEINSLAMTKYNDALNRSEARDAARARAVDARLEQQSSGSESSAEPPPQAQGRGLRTRTLQTLGITLAADEPGAEAPAAAAPAAEDGDEDESDVASPTSSARVPNFPLMLKKGTTQWLDTMLGQARDLRYAEVAQIQATTNARVMEILASSDLGIYDTIEEMLEATYDDTIVAANTLLQQHWSPATMKTLMSVAKIAGNSTTETFHKLYKIWTDKARRSDLKSAAVDEDALRFLRPFIGKRFTLEGGLAKMAELNADASANEWNVPARKIHRVLGLVEETQATRIIVHRYYEKPVEGITEDEVL